MLQNKEYFLVDDISYEISRLSFYCVPAQMLFVILGGFTYDLLGRKITIGSAFILCGGFVFFMPYTGPNIYPYLLITKLLTIMIIQPIFSHPLLNDIVKANYRSRGIAFIHLGINLGLLLAHFMAQFTTLLDPTLSFAISCLFAFFSAIIAFIIVPEPL